MVEKGAEVQVVLRCKVQDETHPSQEGDDGGAQAARIEVPSQAAYTRTACRKGTTAGAAAAAAAGAGAAATTESTESTEQKQQDADRGSRLAGHEAQETRFGVERHPGEGAATGVQPGKTSSLTSLTSLKQLDQADTDKATEKASTSTGSHLFKRLRTINDWQWKSKRGSKEEEEHAAGAEAAEEEDAAEDEGAPVLRIIDSVVIRIPIGGRME